MANHAAIEQQNGHLEAKLPHPLGIRIDIQDVHGRDARLALQRRQLLEHLLAQMATLAAHHHEAGRQGHYLRRCGAIPRPSVAEAGVDERGDVDFTCVAMNFTVFGGTSPTTVTW